MVLNMFIKSVQTFLVCFDRIYMEIDINNQIFFMKIVELLTVLIIIMMKILIIISQIINHIIQPVLINYMINAKIYNKMNNLNFINLNNTNKDNIIKQIKILFMDILVKTFTVENKNM